MAIFIQEGAAIDYTPSSDKDAGDIVIIGELIGVVKRDITGGDLGALHTEGVYQLTQDEVLDDSANLSQGDAVYLDPDGECFGLAVEDGDSDGVKAKLIPGLSLGTATATAS